MSRQPRDPLSHWWSPLQWLRIACSAWVDQVWYWRNVRPHLRGRTQGWGLFAQAALGAALLSALVTAEVIWNLQVHGLGGITWAVLAGGGSGVVIGVLGGALTVRTRGMASGAAACVVEEPAWALALSLAWAVAAVGGWEAVAGKGLGWAVAASLAIGGSVGWGEGSYDGLANHNHEQWWEILPKGLLLGVLVMGAIAKSLSGFLAAAGLLAGGYLLAFWLGRLWSVRQVDDETRRRLVDPE